ncbi:MAG: FMN-binding negative transcriptional regulator [Steroidobacteraceae bacterium]
MYRVPHYDESRIEVLHELIRSNPFGTLVTTASSDLSANHIPMLLRTHESSAGSIVGHIARNNPVWKSASNGGSVLAIFQGPDHYISPRWYFTGQSDGTAVPTWNYAVVHVKGAIEWVEDADWLRQLLDDTGRAFESGDRPWRLSEVPIDYRDRLVSGIIGFRIPIDSLQGKFKLHQKASVEDRSQLIASLLSIGRDASVAMAKAIELAAKK